MSREISLQVQINSAGQRCGLRWCSALLQYVKFVSVDDDELQQQAETQEQEHAMDNYKRRRRRPGSGRQEQVDVTDRRMLTHA